MITFGLIVTVLVSSVVSCWTGAMSMEFFSERFIALWQPVLLLLISICALAMVFVVGARLISGSWPA